jgi:hypothetical protein
MNYDDNYKNLPGLNMRNTTPAQNMATVLKMQSQDGYLHLTISGIRTHHCNGDMH